MTVELNIRSVKSASIVKGACWSLWQGNPDYHFHYEKVSQRQLEVVVIELVLLSICLTFDHSKPPYYRFIIFLSCFLQWGELASPKNELIILPLLLCFPLELYVFKLYY